MTKTLKLEDSTAKKIYKTADKELKVILENTFTKEFFSEDITDRINCWEDVCEEVGIDSDSIPYKNPKTKFERYMNACYMIPYITQALNEDEKFDFTNLNQYKYYVWWKREGSRWLLSFVHCLYCFANLGYGHYFKSEKLALHAKDKFYKVWLDFLPE